MSRRPTQVNVGLGADSPAIARLWRCPRPPGVAVRSPARYLVDVRPLLFACALAFAAPSLARAYEDQVVLTLDAGYAATLASDAPTHGLGFGLGVNIGLGDAWALQTRLSYAVHPGGGGPLHVGIAGVEVVYLLDILEIVPFFGLGVDGVATALDGNVRGDLGLHAVVGVDWLVTRRWLVGLEVRPYVLPLSLAETGGVPGYLTVDLRVGLVFDRF